MSMGYLPRIKNVSRTWTPIFGHLSHADSDYFGACLLQLLKVVNRGAKLAPRLKSSIHRIHNNNNNLPKLCSELCRHPEVF